MLPGRDGMEICKNIRIFSRVPIIMVTALVEEIDRLLDWNLVRMTTSASLQSRESRCSG